MPEGGGPEQDSSLLTPGDLKPAVLPTTLFPQNHTLPRLCLTHSLCPSAPLIPLGPDGHQLDWFRQQTITHSHTFSPTYCHTHRESCSHTHTHTYRHRHCCSHMLMMFQADFLCFCFCFCKIIWFKRNWWKGFVVVGWMSDISSNHPKFLQASWEAFLWKWPGKN